MADVALTEFTDLDADELHLVKRGANGFPPLLAKAAAEVEAAKAETDDDDAEEAEMTKACGDAECGVCADVEKSKLKAADRKKLPKGSFAVPDKAPGSGSYPIPDEAHARDALARASGKPVEARVKAAVRRKFPNIDQAEKAQPAFATDESLLRATDHVRQFAESSVTGTPMTAGTREPEGNDNPATRGGATTYVIPAEAKVTHPQQTSSVAAKVAYAISSLAEAAERISQMRARGAAKGDGWLAQDNPAGASLGDSAELTPLDEALAVVADIAFSDEDAQKSDETVEKVGRRLSTKTETALRAARDHLTTLLGEDTTPTQAGHGAGVHSEEEMMTTTLTKAELGEEIAKAIAADRKARKEAKKAKAAKESANNGGDVTSTTGGDRHDADDLSSFAGTSKPGSSVGGAAKADDTDRLTELEKQLNETKALLEKQLAKARPGGPNLTGTIPAGFTAAAEGRQGEGVVKSAEDQHIEKLRKEYDEALAGKDMQRAAVASYALSKAELVQMHRQGDRPREFNAR